MAGFAAATTGKKSGDIKSAVRDIICADTALLEIDPDTVLVSERAEARLRAAPARLSGGCDTPPTVLDALVLEVLDPLLRDWPERNLAPLVERLVEAEMGRIMESGDCTKQLEAATAVV